MTLSISGTVSAQTVSTPPAPAPAATGQASQSQPAEDTVTLSQSAQVSQLSAQGQSPSQIAENLGMPVSLVDLDLGIVAAPTTAATGASPAAAVREAVKSTST